MPAGAGVAKDHGPAGRTADVRIGRVCKHFFNFFFRDAVRGTMLDITIRIVIKVPENRIEGNIAGSLSCGIIIPHRGLQRQAAIGSLFGGASTLAQQEIDDPAAAHMLAGLAAVIQDVSVEAARFFQGVGQDRKTIERSLLVNALGETDGNPAGPSPDRRSDGDRMKWVAKDVAQETSLVSDHAFHAGPASRFRGIFTCTAGGE
jgi:hypothetical protein